MALPPLQSPSSRGFAFWALAMLCPALWSASSLAHAADAELPASHAAPLTSATPTARCEADYGGRAEKLVLPPTTDVYATQSVTLGKRFRFQAQYLSERGKLKTWVYELRERGPVPLHAAEYPLPADACHAGSAGGKRMTDFGLNKVYSSDFERELFFRCTSTCE